VLAPQAIPPVSLIGTFHAVRRLLGQAHVPVWMLRPYEIGLAGLQQLLFGVLPDRFQEAVAEDAWLVLPRLVDQHH